jgi:hypothetical protein
MLAHHQHIADITKLAGFVIPFVKLQLMQYFDHIILFPRPFLQMRNQFVQKLISQIFTDFVFLIDHSA